MSKPDAAPSSDDHVPEDRPAAAESQAEADEQAPTQDETVTEEEEPGKEESDAEAGEQPDDDLPEWEPLTPEILEEEAIRGDFMLRWAAILLALLLGWTVVDRTDVLVDVKSGQYLASHGILPPATDVFSATATDRRWVNLSWLWDLLVGGIDRLAGPAGLSVLSALIACATMWFVVQTSVPGVSTWWGSICAVLAVLACFPSLTATPEIVTLLGAACTMWLLLRGRWDPARSLWPLVGLFLLWGNLDGRSWIGGVILIMFTLGTWLDGFRTFPAGELELPVKRLGTVTACSLLALLVHPFLWETWLAPVRLYGVEYPALQAYFSADVPFASNYHAAVVMEFWKHFNLFNAVALLLMAIAGVTLLLNRERLRVSSILVLLAVNVIGIAGGRELAVAAIVNCILATVNGQEWYRATFRQTYRVEAAEILFSRAGRAVTVLAVFALAFAAVSGHLMGAQGRRVGMGLAPELSQTIDSYREVLADSFDDRAFNFRLEQGDILIWLGMKPFIDSRVGLYGGSDSLIPLHLGLRQSLRLTENEQVNEENAEFWSEAFDQHEINLALPRLSGVVRDEPTYYSLLISPHWQLTSQGAASAAFYRTNSRNEELTAYLTERDATQFVARFLRTDSDESEPQGPRGVWPQPPSFYDKYLYLPQQTVPNAVRLAKHYEELLLDIALPNQRLDDAIALAYESIREAREGLRVDPNSAAGYRILGDAYRFLERVETSFQLQPVQVLPASLRYYQMIAALHQALDARPDDLQTKYDLFEVYHQHGRPDLALKYLELVEEAAGATSLLSVTDPNRQEQEEFNDALREELQAIVEQVRDQNDAAEPTPAGRLQAAQIAYAAGCPSLALEVLEEDLTIAASNPLARLLIGMLLLEVGRTSEALEQLESLRGTPVEQQAPNWAEVTAFCNLAADQLLSARATLADNHARLCERMTADVLESAPLRFLGPVLNPDGSLDWGAADGLAAVRELQTIAILNSTFPSLVAHNELMRALIAIEMGNNSDAARLFEQIIARDPDSPARPLIEYYYRLLTGQEFPQAPEPVEVSLEPDLFGEEQPDESNLPPADEDFAGPTPSGDLPPQPMDAK